MKMDLNRTNGWKEINGYQFIEEKYLSDIKSVGLIYRHKKSGAKIAVLSNEDDNKVFSIGFCTPPEDSTGVAHIVEHTVLCGSKEFPAKDPFVELVKGSLNTFLNAMTYPDKTVYPVASCNDKDFQNLMHVYLDAVFYPNIYRKEEIFKQEGWHYELNHLDDEITYNGVVYNEMKGAFSSPEQKLFRLIQNTLYPDTTYGIESGGDPEAIPDLTYEQFLDFHGRYYHPSNSYIYLYGNMDVEEKLSWIDVNYLSNFDQIEVESGVKKQTPFDRVRERVDYYSVSKGEDTKNKTYLSYNVSIEDCLKKEYYLAFQILNYVLLGAPGAPLKQALLDAGIGNDIISSYETGILQPYFSIIAKETEENRKKEFVKVITDTLQEIVEKGINEKSLRAAINYYEFKYRESDFGNIPKGLMYGLEILESWLYDENQPFLHLDANDTFSYLKEQIGKGYYENLIQKYLLDNLYGAIVIVKPMEGLTDRAEEKTKEKLAAFKKSQSKAELERLIEETKALKKYQEEPTPKEDMEKIPLLNISDIDKKIKPLCNHVVSMDQVKVIHHNIFTNGIIYLQLAFPIQKYMEYLPHLSFLSHLLGNVNTKSCSYLELSNEINIHTGGIGTDTQCYSTVGEIDEIKPYFVVSTKVLYDNLDYAFSLIKEMLLHSFLEDEKRLKEILAETRSRLQMRMNSSGHVIAVNRCMGYFSKSGAFTDQCDGYEFYEFINYYYQNFDQEKTALVSILKKLIHVLFTKENLLISLTADEKGFSCFKEKIPAFLEDLKAKSENLNDSKAIWKAERKKNEGFKTSGQIQYVARGGNFLQEGFSFDGSLKVLKVILEYDYLWNELRVKGGAYGCMCGFGYSGNSYLVSYRDPNLLKTNEIYEMAVDYIKNFEVSERDMTKYIIGAISNMDMPLTPSNQGKRSFAAYLSNMTEELLQKDRDEVLRTDVSIIRGQAKLLEAVLNEGYICVIGNEKKIEENKELFQSRKSLIF